MKNILQEIAENKRREIEAFYRYTLKRRTISLSDQYLTTAISMSHALRVSSTGIIAEFKRRSPSKGEIFPMADVAKIIPAYVEGGAAACSVLTDTRYFGGADTDLALAKTLSEKMPLLRKDFIISEVQIEEAKVLGASAVLLIATILSKEELFDFNEYAHSLNMEALVEIHDLKELDKITFLPDMLGVNNRNLTSFKTDINHSYDIINYLPKATVLIAESGIKTPDDVKRLRDAGYSGFLIGETFMSTPDPGKTLKQFVYEINR